MNRWTVVCATGHRPQHLSPRARRWIPTELARVSRKLRDQYGTRVAISGMALGTDLWWAAAALDNDLDLWAHIPFPQQPDRWKAPHQAIWRAMLSRAAQVRCYGQAYSVELLHARNDGMLRESAAVVAVWDPTRRTGGTVSAVTKAANRQLPVVHLNPVTFTTGFLTPEDLQCRLRT